MTRHVIFYFPRWYTSRLRHYLRHKLSHTTYVKVVISILETTTSYNLAKDPFVERGITTYHTPNYIIKKGRSKLHSFPIQLALWREWIITIATSLTNPTVFTMDKEFSSAINSHATTFCDCPSLSCGCSAQTRWAFFSNSPSGRSFDYMIITFHNYYFLWHPGQQ